MLLTLSAMPRLMAESSIVKYHSRSRSACVRRREAGRGHENFSGAGAWREAAERGGTLRRTHLGRLLLLWVGVEDVVVTLERRARPQAQLVEAAGANV